jgi:predicted nucleic acid-binding Zn ribbon protein
VRREGWESVTYRRRVIKPAKPTRVSEVLEGYLRTAGLAQRVGLAAVVDAWPALVGPRIARAAVAESVTVDGTLFVRVPSSAWRQELSLMAPEILALVNRGRKDGRIARIRWLVGEERQVQEGHPDERTRGHAYGRATRSPTRKGGA